MRRRRKLIFLSHRWRRWRSEYYAASRHLPKTRTQNANAHQTCELQELRAARSSLLNKWHLVHQKIEIQIPKRENHMRNQPNLQNELQFQVEHLEDRRMLAGNVDVVVNDAGNIFVTGDNESNWIRFREVTVGQVSVLRVERLTLDTQITYNGQTNSSFDLFDAASNPTVKLKMGDGDDAVLFRDTNLGSVTGNLGRGHDGLSIDRSTVEGDVIVNAGSGAYNDQVFLQLSTVAGNVKASLGAATSEFEAGTIDHDRFQTNQVEFLGDVSVRQSGGRAVVLESSTIYRGDATFSLGSGANIHASQLTEYDGSFKIKTGSGKDNLLLQGSKFHGDVFIATGSGNDVVNVVPVSNVNGVFQVATDVGTSMKIATGGGNDLVTTTGEFSSQVVLLTGGGDDTLNYTNFQNAGDKSRLIGGGGSNDVLFAYTPIDAVVNGFESIEDA